MIISLNIHGEDAAMTVIEENGKFLMLSHDDSKVVDYAKKNKTVEATVKNETKIFNCNVDDNIEDAERLFEKLEEKNINYFDKFSQDMVVIVLSL